jgi:AcrR family transcriptional regulator
MRTERARATPAARTKTPKGARSREHVYRAALAVLRRRGYERATMREIARAAGVSLGAAYHYFPSKDAIVMAYYDESAAAHEAAVRARGGDTFAERLDAIFQAKIDTTVDDRKLLGALFRAVGEPTHPLSPFSRRTAAVRARNLALFQALLADEPARTRRTLARALWLVELALLLVLLHDGSGGKRTRRLAHMAARAIAQAWPLLRSPAAAPLFAQLDELFGL